MNNNVINRQVECDSFYLSQNNLDDIYKSWWDDGNVSVLNKAECGNGGTDGIIQYALRNNRSCVICVPNVGVVTSKEDSKYGKEEKYKGKFCFAYGDKKIDSDAQIILCTYDKFKEEVIETDRGYNLEWQNGIFDVNYWKTRLVVFDEFHKLVDDSGFREICDVTTYRILNLPNVLLMSATPNYEYINTLADIHKNFGRERKVVVYDIKYGVDVHIPRFQYDDDGTLLNGYRINIVRLKSTKKETRGINALRDIIVHTYNMKKNDDVDDRYKHIVIFWNNARDILDMIGKLGYNDVEVLCSEQKEYMFGEYYSNVFNDDKRIHFFTSAYFTGCDIDVKVGMCLIIGSPRVDCTCYNGRDLQQMLGRFRKGVGKINLVYFDVNNSIVEHSNLYDKLENARKEVKLQEYERINEHNGDIVNGKDYIKNVVSLIRLREQYNCVDTWKDVNKLSEYINNISKYESTILKETGIKKALDECKGDYKKHKTLTFNEARNRVCDGKTVTVSEYKRVGTIKKYLSIYGDENTKKASLRDMENAVKLITNTNGGIQNTDDFETYLRGIKDDNLFTKEERCSKLGIKEGYQPWNYVSYIINLLEGRSIPRYEVNSVLRKWFNVCCLFIESDSDDDNKSEFDSQILIISLGRLSGKSSMMVDNNINYLSSYPSKNPLFPGIEPINDIEDNHITDDINLSLESKLLHHKDNKRYCLVRTLTDIFNHSTKQTCIVKNIRKELKGKYLTLYNYVMEDKVNRLPQKKNTSEWKSIKKWNQSEISEFYYQTKKGVLYDERWFGKETMYLVDSFILDIDDGLKFSEFRNQYRDFEWYAYPSISNTDDDWHKFRVIFPNTTTLTIKGENNLKILKVLRLNICSSEDHHHGLYSFINDEDMQKMVHHSGKKIDYNQEMVDSLQHLFEGFENYTKNASDLASETASGETSVSEFTIDEAKEYLKAQKEKARSGKQGAFHDACCHLYTRKHFPFDQFDEILNWIRTDSFFDFDDYNHMNSWRQQLPKYLSKHLK